MIIKFNIEQDTKKLFELIFTDGGEEVDRRPRLMRAVFYDVSKIQYVHLLSKARKYTRPGQVQAARKKNECSSAKTDLNVFLVCCSVFWSSL